MNQPKEPKEANRAPLFGILSPGEKRMRTFPVLPSGVMPLLQNFPGGGVRLLEQSATSITIENTSGVRAPFSILFVTQDQVKKLMVLKQAIDGISQLRKKPQ